MENNARSLEIKKIAVFFQTCIENIANAIFCYNISQYFSIFWINCLTVSFATLDRKYSH